MKQHHRRVCSVAHGSLGIQARRITFVVAVYKDKRPLFSALVTQCIHCGRAESSMEGNRIEDACGVAGSADAVGEFRIGENRIDNVKHTRSERKMDR
jgi:hypothetical protein